MNKKNNKQKLRYVKKYKARLLTGTLFMLLASAFQLSLPLVLAYFIDNLNQMSSHEMAVILIGALILVSLYSVASAIRFYLFDTAGTFIVTDIKRALYRAFLKQDIHFHTQQLSGDLNSRLSNDTETVKFALSICLTNALKASILCIGTFVMLAFLSTTLSLAVLIVVPLSIFSAKLFGNKIKGSARILQMHTAEANQFSQESLTNIRLLQAFNQQNRNQKNYREKTRSLKHTATKNTRIMASFQIVSSFITYVSIVVILAIGGYMIINSVLTVGELTSFIIYTGMFASAANGLTGFWTEWMRSIGATEHIFQLLNRSPDYQKSEYLKTIERRTGEIELKDVNFSYPSTPNKLMLKKINLRIAPGEAIAIVGPSGAGKSTLTSLLLDFYQPTAGKILFDEIDARQLSSETIRKSIALVEQEPKLFSGSIADNIAFGHNASSVDITDIISAAKSANAHDFIAQLPFGYETMVGDNGVKLSGGQKQRIAIARALLRDPAILILDEATSALDTQSEILVQSALERLMSGRTTIMIAHRYSTIALASRIVVLNDGSIEQIGSHEEMRQQRDSLYFRLFSSQIPEVKFQKIE